MTIHFLPLLGIMGWDDLLLGALFSAIAGAGVNAAVPKSGMTTPEAVPKPNTQGMDFTQMLQQQQQSQLPKIQLQNRLPPPQY